MPDPIPPKMRPPVVALHCSGSDARQWRRLAAALGPASDVIAPNLIGSAETGPWCGAHAFTLSDEAAAIIALVDSLDRPVHLVGHSYGGGVALEVAAARPEQIESVALYEPSAFHVLRRARQDEAAAEIEELARRVGAGVVDGAYAAAVEEFVDYWNGPGAWAALDAMKQQALIRWLPKAPLDFRALLDASRPLADYAALDMPILLMQGERARLPSRRVIDVLSTVLPMPERVTISGAGHMGPFTHEQEVFDRLARHVRTATQRSYRRSAA